MAKAQKAKPAARKAAPAKWGAPQQRDYDAIARRAEALGKKLKPEDFDKKGNPVGPWAKVVADLDAWAKKYKVKLKTEEHDHGQPGGAGGTPKPMIGGGFCPGRTTSTEVIDNMDGSKFTFNHECTLRRKTLLGRCVYSCTSTGFTL